MTECTCYRIWPVPVHLTGRARRWDRRGIRIRHRATGRVWRELTGLRRQSSALGGLSGQRGRPRPRWRLSGIAGNCHRRSAPGRLVRRQAQVEVAISTRQYATFGSTSHAAIWSGSAESFVDLHPSGSSGSEIRGMSGDVQVGVSSGHAFLWTGTAGDAVHLHLYVTGSDRGSAAYGVASDGTIVGLVSFGPGSTYTAAMWSPIPEPSSLLMFAAGVLTWAIAEARRSRGMCGVQGSHISCRR